jgi:septal ring factor EnvC (AmiA/AmiB activator)
MWRAAFIALVLAGAAMPAQADDACVRNSQSVEEMIRCPDANAQGVPLSDSSPACDRFGERRLARPVSGRRVLGFNEKTRYGSSSKGVVIEAPAGAGVVAPADGSVTFAGEFRSYGTMVILSCGCDRSFIIAGLKTVGVSVGQTVLQGAHLGSMDAAGASEPPVLYVELRYKGQAVDPGADIAGP